VLQVISSRKDALPTWPRVVWAVKKTKIIGMGAKVPKWQEIEGPLAAASAAMLFRQGGVAPLSAAKDRSIV